MGHEYDEQADDDAAQLRFTPTFGPSIPTRYGYRPRALFRTLREIRPALIHAEAEPYSVAAQELAIIAGLMRVPLALYVWQNHTTRARRLCSVATLFECSAILCATDQISDAWQFSRRPRYVVPPGLDLARFHPSDGRSAARRPARVGYLGRTSRPKGVDLLIHAASEGGDWQLAINATPGWDELAALAKGLGLSDRVDFESITYEDVPKFLNTLDVLVLPSRTTDGWREQFGRVLIEAMACGVPVIGSSSGSIPSTIGGAGTVFAEGDHHELFDAIQGLIEDPLRWLNFRMLGLRRAQEFNWANVNARTEDIYDAILEIP